MSGDDTPKRKRTRKRGRPTDVVTVAELIPTTVSLLVRTYPHITIDQLNQLARLAQAWRELKSEIRDNELERKYRRQVIEPRLMSPRSSLEPLIMQGEPATSDDGTTTQAGHYKRERE